jgi:hypothetical protein
MVLKVEIGSLPGFTVQEGKLEFMKETRLRESFRKVKLTFSAENRSGYMDFATGRLCQPTPTPTACLDVPPPQKMGSGVVD